jgi:DNA-binding winged helix-turn-helix (wHTH) protein/tetratricopeptide (TPR) repeat protein
MGDPEPLRLHFDAFDLDEADARLTRNGQAIALPPKAFAVLCTLARRPGQLVTKSALLDAVWGHQYVSESVLKTMISALRAALSDDAKQPRYIETAARRGYRFIAAPSAAGTRNASADAVAGPSRESAGELRGGPLLIGRQSELEQLHAAWRKAVAGGRQVFWVAGEAGVGKTTLIDRFLNELEPVAWARGQCVEQYGTDEPYLPVLEALGALCRNDPAVGPMLRAVAPTWLIQLPWLSDETEREALHRELAGTGQDRMLRELGELLDRYTQRQPLMLVTEDRHWSDHATVRLIDHIARRRGQARLMWLASFRLAEVISEEHPLKGLRHELRLHRLCEEIVLDSFSEREVGDYVDRRFPDAEVSEAFVRVVHTHTDGLPLFVVNVIDDLVSQGALQPGESGPLADRSGASLQVPESLAGVVEKQIARLPVEVRTMLEAASVCGVEFRPDTVADALERDVSWVGEQCDELVRRQHWLSHVALGRRSDGVLNARYAFRHALYRHVFYQRIGALTRAQLHSHVALSMERSRASGIAVTAAELASHFERSQDVPAALRHYGEAAESALKHFAPAEAIAVTAHALALLPRCPEGNERLELELALVAPRAAACAQVLGVASPEAAAAFDRTHALCNLLPGTATRAMELSGLGWVFYVRGEYAQARALAERIHALAGSRGDRLLHVAACNLMGAILTHQGDLTAAKQWLERGIALFAELREAPAHARFVIDLGVAMQSRICQVLLHLGFVDQARAQSDAALARARALGQPYAQMLALFYGAALQVGLGRLERVQALTAALQKTVSDHAFAQGEGLWRSLQGWTLARLGQTDAGHALILEGYEYHMRHSMMSGAASVLGYAAETQILAGRWSDAQTRLEEALALAQRIGERIFLPQLLVLQGQIALGRGESGAARSSMQAAVAEARAQEALWLELSALVALCELGDPAPTDLHALKDARIRLREGDDTPLVARVDRLLQAA